MKNLPVKLTEEEQVATFSEVFTLLTTPDELQAFKETELAILYLQTIHSLTIDQVAVRLNLKRTSVRNYRTFLRAKLVITMRLTPEQTEVNPFNIFHAWYWYLIGQHATAEEAA